MTHTLLKKTTLALGISLMAFALTALPTVAQAQSAQKSYTAPGESNPDAFAKSKPGKTDGVSVKSKQKSVQQPKVVQKSEEPATALETLKQKVAADKSPEKTVKPVETSELVKKVTYGDDVQDWTAQPQDTVQTLLTKWSDESGWTLVWKLDRDYVLEAGVVFRGTYMDAAMALLRSFARANPAPIGTFYKGNRVLVVSTREDENEG